jgi:hypothetical protein
MSHVELSSRLALDVISKGWGGFSMYRDLTQPQARPIGSRGTESPFVNDAAIKNLIVIVFFYT